MFRKLGYLLMIVAVLTATGTHWALLQTVAWTTMLANNLRNGCLAEAVENTFDGKHPCSLCKQITAGKKSEKKTEFSISLKKLEFISERISFLFAAPTDFRLQTWQCPVMRAVAHKPPVPPPRSFFV